MKGMFNHVPQGVKESRVFKKAEATLNVIHDVAGAFNGKQQGGIQNLYDSTGGSPGAVENKAARQGMDPALIKAVIAMLKGEAGDGSSAAGREGFNLGKMIKVAVSLTKNGGGGASGGGFDGFISLLRGISGGRGGDGQTDNIIKTLIGLAKSFFTMQSGKNSSIKEWGIAGADANRDDNNFKNWGISLVKDLIFKGKRQNEKVHGDPTGKEADKGRIKGWFDDHPEIGKMQKDIFDDVFDTTDDDMKRDDPAPVIPKPSGFTPDCSILDNASILFLNNNILLELRKNWRFLYSTRTHPRTFNELFKAIECKGPTLIVVRSSTGREMLGAFASTSWIDSKGEWMGNGDSFIFSLKPQMTVFYATGKNDNYLSLDRASGLGLGGKVNHFGFGIPAKMNKVTYNEEVETYDLPDIFPREMEINHLEVWGLGPAPNPSTERSRVTVHKANLNVRRGYVDLSDLADQLC